MKGDKEDGHGADGTMTREMLLTDPDQAADFVKRTQLDALAIAIGTSHGAYKFTRKPTGDILAIERIKEIHRRIPNTHLVMHGSSRCRRTCSKRSASFGGTMKETYGVPVEEIQEAIKHGVRKINIDTDIRLAMTAAIRKFFAENPGKFDPREYLKPAKRSRQENLQAALPAVRLRRAGRQDQRGAAQQDGAQVPDGRAEPARALKAPARPSTRRTGSDPGRIPGTRPPNVLLGHSAGFFSAHAGPYVARSAIRGRAGNPLTRPRGL